MKFKEIIMA